MKPTTNSILRFISRVVLLIVSTIGPCLVYYIYKDPFKVLRHYDNYFENPYINNRRLGINKGMITVRTYLDNLKSDSLSIPYNAFIFGSSISCYYDALEWKTLLENQISNKSKINPIHFDSSSESPMSMARKVEFLHNTKAPLKYALIVLDPIILANQDKTSPPFIDPIEIQPSISHFLKFHYTFFRGAMNADFFKSIIASQMVGQPLNIGHNPIFQNQPIVYCKEFNQENIPQWDSLISENAKYFYDTHPLIDPAKEFYSGDPVITKEKEVAFKKIAGIFREHNTDYNIIISPNRRGVYLSKKDLKILHNIFSSERVHDFSYTHAHYLENDTLLYDNTHYRPPFALVLMKATYLPMDTSLINSSRKLIRKE